MTTPVNINSGGGGGGGGGGSFGNMDMMKSQILTMMALRGGDTEKGIFTAIYAILLISLIDVFFRYFPIICNNISQLAKKYLETRMKTMKIPIMSSVTGETVEEASIFLIRNYKDKEATSITDVLPESELVDAVIEYICSLDNTKHLKYINKYYLNSTDEIKVNNDIKAKLEHIDIDTKNNQINSISVKLYSTTIKVSIMREQLKKIHAEYRIEKSNKLGNQRFFFNEFHVEPIKDANGQYRYETAPKRITFNMTPFNTFKSMENIFGSHIKDIRERVNLFVNHPEWYEKRGIPYTLGILLHGKPGCGKTSLIKAIAKDTSRHVFNINIRKTTTQKQLLNLFFDENVNTLNSSNENSVISIPLDKRIYVIEDIDCMTDVVLDRKYLDAINTKDTEALEQFTDDQDLENKELEIANMLKTTYFDKNNNNNNNTKQQKSELTGQPMDTNTNVETKTKTKDENRDEINLSFLLNLLDGVLETPGRILIMTSNYPKRLDKALIRPGRIDININVRNADLNMIKEMLCHFYSLDKQKVENIKLPVELDNVFTPAEIIAILCNNYKSYDNAIIELLEKLEKNLKTKQELKISREKTEKERMVKERLEQERIEQERIETNNGCSGWLNTSIESLKKNNVKNDNDKNSNFSNSSNIINFKNMDSSDYGIPTDVINQLKNMDSNENSNELITVNGATNIIYNKDFKIEDNKIVKKMTQEKITNIDKIDNGRGKDKLEDTIAKLPKLPVDIEGIINCGDQEKHIFNIDNLYKNIDGKPSLPTTYSPMFDKINSDDSIILNDYTDNYERDIGNNNEYNKNLLQSKNKNDNNHNINPVNSCNNYCSLDEAFGSII